MDSIINSFYTWTTAQGQKSKGRVKGIDNISLEGIARLRELILELAVRGKLVPQDPNDEPASELIDKIAKEKAKLVKEGKIKKQKPFSKISTDEIYFKLPQSWIWQRLGEVGYTQTGGTPSKNNKSYFGHDIPFIKPGHIYSSQVDYSNEGLSDKGAEALGRIAPAQSILMVCIGTIGKCNLIDRTCAFNQQINSITPYTHISEYLLIALRSKYFQNLLWDRSSSTTIAILNKGKWENLTFPLPPLPEQQRIVAKVDELMALCDQLEHREMDHLKSHALLVETLLGTLTRAADSEELRAAWHRMARHFEDLFTTEESIDQLKQTILQLAVMGKLVPQNPADESANKLLEKISAEKAKLIKEGKIKKQKPLPEITEEEKPFELPEGWEWCRMENITLHSEAGWSPKCEETSRELGKWGVLKVSAVTWDEFRPDENKQLPSHLEPRPEFEVQKNNFLISRANTAELVAKSVIVQDDSGKKLMMSDKIIRFSFSDRIFPLYINLVNNSKWSRNYYARVAGGTSSSMKNVSRKQIQTLVIGLPPLKEQHRIVVKVDELFALCDQLKSRITHAQEIKNLMAEAVVEGAIVQ